MRRLLPVLFALVLSAPAVQAVVLSGGDGGSTNNLIAPTNGAPWQYVARLDVNNASGVYLGNGFILTANHVTFPGSALINDTLYSIDEAYGQRQIGGADIKLLRILGDPGLAALALIGARDTDTSQASTVVGWGVGRGGALPDSNGWNWAGDESRAKRWGLNMTLGNYVLDGTGRRYLATDFGRFEGEDESSMALGDSGGAVFQKFGNTWKLAGITAGVDTNGRALYDRDPIFPFDQPDRSFYVPIKEHRDAIIAGIAVPEPTSAILLAVGGAALLGYRRSRSR